MTDNGAIRLQVHDAKMAFASVSTGAWISTCGSARLYHYPSRQPGWELLVKRDGHEYVGSGKTPGQCAHDVSSRLSAMLEYYRRLQDPAWLEKRARKTANRKARGRRRC